MHTRHCLKLADRIHALLERELGQGIERPRLLAEPLYARDVLLVCDALLATDGPLLARAFRRAAAAPDESQPGTRPSRWGALFGWGSGLAKDHGQALRQALSSRSNSAPSAT
ncbi:MAG: hypothetical protein RL227_179 [Pseudomonadota bacterium]